MDLLSSYKSKYYEIVVVGKNANEKVKELNRTYLPNKLVAGGISESNSPLLERRYVEGETLIYVCVNNTCKLPVTEISTALESIKANPQ